MNLTTDWKAMYEECLKEIGKYESQLAKQSDALKMAEVALKMLSKDEDHWTSSIAKRGE